MAGQSFGDRIVAAQHTIIGSDMSKSVCKATTSEIMGPKKKHLDYLHSLTFEPNINIPELVDILVERSKQVKWVIVFKTLVTTHHLMCYGNERFLQHLASRNSLFNLGNFLDKTGVQGYDMSTYIRRYAKYLNEKGLAYRVVAFDFTRVKRGKNDGMLRTFSAEKLLKTLPTLQSLLDALLEFDANPNELRNGVINSAFMLVFKDLIRLFACYNDGIINLLEKYFEMKKQQCKEGLEIYKKFLIRMTKVSEVLKVAEQVGIDKGDIPDLTKAPSSLLDALEQHLASLEGKKGGAKATTPNVQVAMFDSMSTSLQKIDEKDQKSALIEEEERLKAFKEQREKEKGEVSQITPSSQPVSSAAPSTTTDGFGTDLFDSFTAQQPPPVSNNVINLMAPAQQTQASTTSDMFGWDSFGASTTTNGLTDNFSQPPQQPQQPQQPNFFANYPTTATASPGKQADIFATDVLAPTPLATVQPPPQMMAAQQPVSSDLEASLASLVNNLNVGGGQRANKDFQPKPEKKLTGGMSYNYPAPTMGSTSFNPSPVHAGVGYGQPMMNPMMGQMQPQAYAPNMQGMMPNMMMGQQQAYYGQQMMQQPPRPTNGGQSLNPNNPFGPMIQF